MINLRQLITRKLKTMKEPDTKVVAQAVFDDIPPDEYGAHLLALLPRTVADTNRRLRSDAFDRMHKGRGSKAKPGAKDKKAKRAKSTRSGRPRNRFDGIPPEVKELLARSVWVGGERKLMADCNHSDLVWIEQQLRRMANENLHRAYEYEHLRTLLTEHRVATVGALPAETIQAVLAAA